MTTKLARTNIVYYPDNPTRNVFRISMEIENKEACWADLFVENDWAHFVYVYVDPAHRSEETISAFIQSAFKLDLGTKNIFWFGISEPLVYFLEKIAMLRPDMTFAASGAVSKIIWATE